MKRKNRRKIWADRRAQKMSKNMHKGYSPIQRQHAFHMIDYHNSTILSLLMKFCKFSKQKHKNETTVKHFTVPKIFSITDNLSESLKFIFTVAYECLSPFLTKVVFEFAECELMDLSASTVLDIIVKEIRDCHKNMILIEASINSSSRVGDMARISGLIPHLDLVKADGKDDIKETDQKIETLKLLYNSDSDIVSTQVVEYITKCLHNNSLALTADGSNKISSMIGEVVDNCKIHSGSIEKWYTIGYCCTDDDRKCSKCSISIINFGNTIANTIQKPKDPQIKRGLKKILKKYKPKWINSTSWNNDDLCTLYALQDGISSLKCNKSPDRGSGTITLIDFLQEIGRNSNGDIPTMTIVSGNSEIRFDGKYRLKQIQITKKGNTYPLQIMAFNEKGSLKQAPDNNNVRHSEVGFCGTIISMNFYIEPSYITDYFVGGKI